MIRLGWGHAPSHYPFPGRLMRRPLPRRLRAVCAAACCAGDRCGRASSAQGRPGGGGWRWWARQPGVVVPRGGRGRLADCDRQRHRDGVEPASPAVAQHRRCGPGQNQERVRHPDRQQPRNHCHHPLRGAHQRKRSRSARRARPHRGRQRQLRHPLPARRRGRRARRAVRLGFGTALARADQRLLGGPRPALPRPLPEPGPDSARRVLLRRGCTRSGVRSHRLDHGDADHHAAHRRGHSAARQAAAVRRPDHGVPQCALPAPTRLARGYAWRVSSIEDSKRTARKEPHARQSSRRPVRDRIG